MKQLLKSAGLAVSASLLSVLVCALGSAAAESSAIPETYAVSATLVKLPDKRSVNLRCSGSGAPVVLFEAGANADSSAWFRVVPLLAGKARACTYDRAGYGFSSVGPLPRDLDADIADLRALVMAARLSPPIVLVGHSLGSNIVRGYVRKFPEDVAGIVLVDPPVQGEDALMPDYWKQEDAVMREQRDAFLMACAKSAEAGEPMRGCLRAPPPWMGARVAASVTANKSRPGYWQTLQSELDANKTVFSSPVPDNERYGDIPLILLSADISDEGIPDEVHRILVKAQAQTQERILAGSSQARQISVAGSSHDIQLDRPEVVASAVIELLDRVRQGTPSARVSEQD